MPFMNSNRNYLSLGLALAALMALTGAALAQQPLTPPRARGAAPRRKASGASAAAGGGGQFGPGDAVVADRSAAANHRDLCRLGGAVPDPERTAAAESLRHGAGHTGAGQG